MGLTPFACVTQQDCVRLVYPDGHVESLSRSCSVYELLLGNPDYFLCGSTPYTLSNSMAADEPLAKGMTYFVCATPNAQPFTEFHPKKSHRSSRILPRFSRQELRSPAHSSAQSRTKVFDFHSATLQQLQSMRNAGGELRRGAQDRHLAVDRPPKHLLKLIFIRHCLQALRLPRNAIDLMEPELATLSDETPTPAPAIKDDLLPILKSAAKCELGLYVSRRQEFYLRRARRRRKIAWKPVLQSISEMSPMVEFLTPVAQQETESKRVSPPRPERKNISPPRQYVSGAPLKDISPPRLPVSAPAPKCSPAQQQQRSRKHNKSLYMA